MTTYALFETALAAARSWHAGLKAASDFCDWPDDLIWQPRAAHPVPATDLLQSLPGQTNAASAPLVAALQDVARHLEWRHTYTAKEVGQNFLDNYGWFELAGPDGHFLTRKTRITVGYWGPGLDYPRHQHRAEELYTVLSGQAGFMADGTADATLLAGDTRYHGPDQPHAMVTTDSPILTLVFWRGEGLADAPAMSAA